MATKKTTSQAEKRVSGAKNKKSTTGNSGVKRSPKKPAPPPKKPPVIKTEYDSPIPATTLTACISLLTFVLFMVIAIKPEGALLRVVQSVVLGLLGRGGFYFAIPALLYLFYINVFQRRTRTRLRSWCLVVCVVLWGAIYHLAVERDEHFWDWSLFGILYNGGLGGSSGGVICGTVALGLEWACGKLLSYGILIISTLLTLLGSMELTPASLLRAIANRPREEDWEDDDYIEPAAIVVNRIANKQLEQKRRRREKALQETQDRNVKALPENTRTAEPGKKALPGDTAASKPKQPKPSNDTGRAVEQRRPRAAEQTQPPQPLPENDTVKQVPGRGAAFMSRIDGEIGAPLAGTSEYVREEIPNVFDEPIDLTAFEPMDESERGGMPELALAEPETVIEQVPIIVEKPSVVPEQATKPRKTKTAAAPEPQETQKSSEGRAMTAKEAAQSADLVAAEIAQGENKPCPEYRFPPMELLKRPGKGSGDGTEEMRENSRRLNETLASFRIDAHIINVTRGPSVTRYEVELDKGVRLNKLTGCADDIALSLGASGVRIAAVPGKISVVGIEVPNRVVTTVSLREVIDSPEFGSAKSKSSFAVGKDIGGSCIIGNIARMPHLLIAGTTGSGKSVCMNSIIISLLYKAGPEDVKLIMVDPKMVELGIYNGIPHLLIPVVTDPKKAAGSLQWAVTEMLRRYKLMSDAGVRDLESYNSIVEAEEQGSRMPQIVVIIDELADMMMVAAKEVEDSICRIAQMGRAAGMHLIIATQRPSADVITGLMKANIPSRIAFSVASAMESRIILDTVGAEKLVGKGDMLYAPIGSGKPLRVQGCFVTDGEVEKVAEFVKANSATDYNQEVLEEIEKKAQQTGKKPGAAEPEPSEEELEGDEMLPAAVDVILETGQASVSMLQRRLKLGYARAARIVDEMEEKGIVGPFQGSKPRAILITKEQWAARQSGGAGSLGPEDDMLEDME